LILTPDLLDVLAREVSLAKQCKGCEEHPILVIRTRYVHIYVTHKLGCVYDRPALRVVPGGEPA
jgi:hypothetical protein